MKKLISVCMALILLLACVPLQASSIDGTPTFAVGTVTAHAGETVDVPILIENNPGIVGLSVTVSFDTDVLTLKNAAEAPLFVDGDGHSVGYYMFGGTYNTSSFTILWDDGTGVNSTQSGTFATLTFEVAEDAPLGDTAISIGYSAGSTFAAAPAPDNTLTEVAFDTRAGAVTVASSEVGGWSFSEDCTLYTYECESGMQIVAGFDPLEPQITDYIETTGGWTYDVVPNAYGGESTGAKLVIYDENGDAVEEYWSVFFGDINGDAVIDQNDLTILRLLIGNKLNTTWAKEYLTTDEFPQTFAADTNSTHDLVLDLMDMTCLRYQIGNKQDINQFIN